LAVVSPTPLFVEDEADHFVAVEERTRSEVLKSARPRTTTASQRKPSDELQRKPSNSAVQVVKLLSLPKLADES
jgi:hypothetical protein